MTGGQVERGQNKYPAYELNDLLQEGIKEYNHRLMAGATPQPVVSNAKDSRSTKSGPDLSQKYRKVNPTCTAPVMKVQQQKRRQDMTNEEAEEELFGMPQNTAKKVKTSLPPITDASSRRSANGATKSTEDESTEDESTEDESTEDETNEVQEKGKAAVESTLERGVASSGPLAASPKSKPASKAKSKPAAKAKSNPKAKAKSKPKSKAKSKPKATADAEGEDFSAEERELKESSTFKPTSAFRKKAGVALSTEEKKLVGISDQGLLRDPDTLDSTKGKKKRKRPTAADWDEEYPDISSEVPDDGGLTDKELIDIGMDDSFSIKTRWVKAPYVWNKKGLLYQKYQRLVNLTSEDGEHLWPEKVAKKYLGMDRDTWKTIRGNQGFFTAKGEPRQRKAKQLVSVRKADGKFKAVQESQEARELASATRYEIIYDKLLQSGDVTMKRMRNTRKRTEALIKDAVASNVISQNWGKEMADAWRAANSEMLQFKDAAVRRIRELEDELEKLKRSTNDTSAQQDRGQSSTTNTPPHAAPDTPTTPLPPATPTIFSISPSLSPSRETSPEETIRLRVIEQIKTEPELPSGDVFSIRGEPVSPKENSLMAGGPKAPKGGVSTLRPISPPTRTKLATCTDLTLWQGDTPPNFPAQS